MPDIIQYAPAKGPKLFWLRRVATVGAAADAVVFVLFVVTRRIQLQHSDPFNNPWSPVSFAALVLFVLVWLLLVPAVIVLRLKHRSLNPLVYVWMFIGGVVLLVNAVQMYRFANP